MSKVLWHVTSSLDGDEMHEAGVPVAGACLALARAGTASRLAPQTQAA
jgi:hypothetical protein